MPQFRLNLCAFVALAFTAFAHSHLIITNPVPYGKSTLDNSPLNADAAPNPSYSGTDYPCKQREGVYDISVMNFMTPETPQELNFEGSASHGGGTCQIAISADKFPIWNSTFKIIQVFQGGCPIDSDGNGLTHPFTFSIPKDFPNGEYALTWVWYNRIGNREIYMNCAPVTVTGGSSSMDVYNSLPNLYLINLPMYGDTCSTLQNSAVEIPHPGQYILKDEAGQSISAASGAKCSAAAASQTEGVSGYSSQTIANIASDAAPGTNADKMVTTTAFGADASAPTAAAATTGSSGGSSATSAASQVSSSAGTGSSAAASSAADSTSAAAMSSGAATTSSSAAAIASSSTFAQMSMSSGAGVTAPSSAVPSGGSASSTGTPGGSSGTCSSTSGGITCSDGGKQFCQCANGQLICQDVAPGTQCVNGGIVKRGLPVVERLPVPRRPQWRPRE